MQTVELKLSNILFSGRGLQTLSCFFYEK